jgi:hypothetical protein
MVEVIDMFFPTLELIKAFKYNNFIIRIQGRIEREWLKNLPALTVLEK